MSRKMIGISLILMLVLITPLFPACTSSEAPTAYTAVIPAVFQTGLKQDIAIALFAGESPASGNVAISLLKDDRSVSEARSYIKSNGTIQLEVPDLAEGDYTLKVRGEAFQDEATVKVRNDNLVFLETDKPIYKPGQSIQIRAITLDSGLLPVSRKITVEVQDAKGIKIFRSEITSDEYGMAETELPVSTEPNLGTWKITAATAKSKTQTDVKVEEYVLPKYEVKVDLPKEWYLVDEPVKGKVSATYSFGRPVKGDLQIIATKYAGTWQDYAKVNLGIDGEADFTLPPAGYVAGVPAAQGNGNVKLQLTVTETSTGYKEKTDTLLKVSQTSTNLTIIPAGSIYKPGLPYSFLVVAETPDNKLVDTEINTHIAYLDKNFNQIKQLDVKKSTEKGKILLEISPPMNSVAMTIDCSAKDSSASKSIEAAYSPTGNFIHLEQATQGTIKAGDEFKFNVFSTAEAKNFYYEVISGGRLVFSSYTQGTEIKLKTTPAMAPSSRLLVYQILPNAEVAADYLPFDVSASYPQTITLEPSSNEARPGDSININIQTEGQAEVGLAAVDKSVFILAENRLNLQQVFDQLEKLYMNPQVELHQVSIYEGIQNWGASDVFKNAGVIVLSNKTIPEGKKYEQARNVEIMGGRNGFGLEKGALPPVAMQAAQAPVPAADTHGQVSGLAEVQRVRQFFPETWIWSKIKTDASGKATIKADVPDSITTWMMRAVAVSKSKGLGIAEGQLTVFQPFFLSVDLPYSTIRGEEFPVNVAVYNYLDQAQSVQVQLEKADWFQLLDDSQKTLQIPANDIGSALFRIRPVKLGNASEVKVTARSPQAADSVVKTLIVEAEGVAREITDNLTLKEGKADTILTTIPQSAIEGSSRAYFTLTSSYLAQTIDGLESLIQMPFGCGEQNMIIFAPDVYITRYLQSSGQLKPEIMAKAEKLMLTGYQRELTYRRNDSSFSAFGQNDKEGSLWLTAFVLKCFSEAKDLIYIDEQVLNSARDWILSHQNSDGSFDSVGFVHHAEMLGGLKGKDALTAYVAIALLQAGDKSGSAKAIAYLEKQLDRTEDIYTLALMACALETAGSGRKDAAHDKLLKLAKEDTNGLFWGDNAVVNESPVTAAPGIKGMPIRPVIQTSAIETTAYATLALTRHGDTLHAAAGARWLVSKRNASGGFGSTQDTVMALQALVEYSTGSRADVNLTVQIKEGEKTQKIQITPQNFDVLQIVEIPVNAELKISASGKGEAIGQVVRRFNLPEVDRPVNDTLKISVDYDANEVAVNDEVKVAVSLSYNPPEKTAAGMLVADISVPTGFAAVKESIEEVLKAQKQFKRYDIAGRKVIFYIENMLPGDRLEFEFRVKALYPVKAKGVMSQAYSYYQPEIASESLSDDITVVEQ
jgi:CD109 antigen